MSGPRLTLACPHCLCGASGPKTSGLIFIAMLIGGRRSTRGGRVSARRKIEALSSGVIRQRRGDGSKAVIPSPRGGKRSNPFA